MALLVLAYDYVLKSVVWLGALVMGVLRGMNLASAAALGLGTDQWLPAAPVLYAAAAYTLYIVAVTFLGAMEDAPSPKRSVRGLVSVPPLVAFLALLVMDHPWPAAGIGAVLVVVWFARVRNREWDQAEIRRAMTWLLLGTMLYTSLLCLASGYAWEALVVALMVLPARWIARSIALT